jgi:hypothetical protein
LQKVPPQRTRKQDKQQSLKHGTFSAFAQAASLQERVNIRKKKRSATLSEQKEILKNTMKDKASGRPQGTLSFQFGKKSKALRGKKTLVHAGSAQRDGSEDLVQAVKQRK